MVETAMTPVRRISGGKPTKPLIDILIVFAASGLAFALEDLVNARGWITIGDVARGASAVVAGALAAIGVVFARGGTFADLGFKRPERWGLVVLQATVVLVLFAAAQALLPLIISAFIAVPEPDMSRYASISGNVGAAIAMALLLPLTASIPEEIIYRGFLIGRLSNIFGASTGGVVVAVLVQALVFGAIHYSWGIGGMFMTLIMGVIWGTAYVLCGRSLWVVILAHSGGHILFVVQLYLTEPLA